MSEQPEVWLSWDPAKPKPLGQDTSGSSQEESQPRSSSCVEWWMHRLENSPAVHENFK